MDEILRYFPQLSEDQQRQLAMLGPLYTEWNEKINVVSRRDIQNLYVHHVLHSLAIAKFLTPAAGTRLLDLGTGGGFPGIPLAIMWPDCHFHLIDRIGKKLRVASDIAQQIGLTNVTFQHGDSGECHERFSYVVSRAVMRLDQLVSLIKKNIATHREPGNKLPNGLLCLKGGELQSELAEVKRPIIEVPLTDYFSEPYFATKSLVYVDM
ncbi:MAG: 16S rRNA (guanine(527)-N(7))-methyltransferase RsmG [Bacteroidales bacterium]|nr:16S rRNA (guanine(527)-N(7))-methyltransferase RsmG [Bacteroidales bacterium]